LASVDVSLQGKFLEYIISSGIEPALQGPFLSHLLNNNIKYYAEIIASVDALLQAAFLKYICAKKIERNEAKIRQLNREFKKRKDEKMREDD